LNIGQGVHHGPPFRSILNDIANFANGHPKEILIFRITNSTDLSANDRKTIRNDLLACFGDKIFKKSENWFDVATSTIGDFWAKNKSILIFTVGKNEGTLEDNENLYGFWNCD